MKANFFVIFVCLMASIAMVGCLGGSSSDDVAAATGTIRGKVVDTAGAVVANATVTNGSKTSTTDGSGNFALENIAAGARVQLTVSKDTYLKTYAFEPLSAGQTALATYTIKAVPAGKTATVANGKTVENNLTVDEVKIKLPAGAIVNSSGTVDDATVTIVHTPPTADKALDTFPGIFAGIATGASTEIPFETFGYTYVDLGTGNSLDPAIGASLTVDVPAAIDPDDLEMPLWRFDTTDGVWKQVATATRLAKGQPFSAHVTTFSWYNLDRPIDVRQLEVTVASYTETYPHGEPGITGTTETTTDTNKTDLTKRIANARVTVKASLETGTDTDNAFNTFSNTGTWQEVKVTNAQGIATFNIPQGRRIIIEVSTPDKTTQGNNGYTVENGIAKALVNMGEMSYGQMDTTQ